MSENSLKKSVEITEKSSKIQGFQSKKYDATIRPYSNLSINRNLLALHNELTPTEFFCMIRLWDWFQSPEVKGLKFVTSRSHLAKLAGVSQDTAKHALQTLKRVGALKTANTSFGVSEYVWNCGLLKWGVTEIQSGGDWKSSGPWLKIIRPLAKNHPASIICTLIIPSLIPFYTLAHAPKNVDNSDGKPIIQDEGDINEALRAGLPEGTINEALWAGLPIRNVVGMADALLENWIYSGGEYWLYDLLPIIESGFINLFEANNVSQEMTSLLVDKNTIYRAKHKSKILFNDDDALFEHCLKLMEAFNE